jgi:hypothetical protein
MAAHHSRFRLDRRRYILPFQLVLIFSIVKQRM